MLTKDKAAEWIAVLVALGACVSSIVSCQKAAASVRAAEGASRVEVWQETQRRWSELRSIGVSDCELAVEFLEADRKDCSSDPPKLTALERDNWKTQFLYLMEEIFVVTEDMPDSLRQPWTEFVRVNLRTPAVCTYSQTVVLHEGNRWYAKFRDEVRKCRDLAATEAVDKTSMTPAAGAKTAEERAMRPMAETKASPALLRAR